MKRKLILLLSAVILLALLLGVYALTGGKADNGNIDTKDDTDTEALGNKIADVKDVDTFTITNANGTFTFKKKGDQWKAEGHENALDRSAVDRMAGVLSALYADRTVEEKPENTAKYGFDKPSAIGECKDIKISLGALTPDGKYYYVMTDRSPAVYMVEATLCNSLNYGLNDFIDKSVTKIDRDTIQELEIKAKGKDDVYVHYDPDNPLARDYAEANGLATLVMEKPVSNMLVYPYNLHNSVLKNLNNLNVTDLVDPAPSDLSKYGLDDPQVQVKIRDTENTVTFKAGSKAPSVNDTEYMYVLINDRPEVFTMDYRSIEPFINASIADFSEKFISLYQRSKVNSIDFGGYKIELKEEGDNKFVQEDGVLRDKRNAYINGKAIDREAFTNFYEQLIGIGFDDIDVNANIQGDPELVITFELADKSKDTAEYYNYNSDFYVVKKGDNTSMLVNKQTVAKVLNEAEKLCK